MDPSVSVTPQNVTNLRVKAVTKTTPTEHTSIGGISIGNKNTG